MSNQVGIVTIYGEFNYGNRLQNYSVCRCFEKWGFQAESLVSVTKKTKKESLKSAAKVLLPIFFKRTVARKYPQLLREKNFKKFTKAHIPTKYIRTKSGSLPKEIEKNYRFFVTGSDQVWNPCFGNFEKLFDDMFLSFAPSEKKMCFSPSFGVSELPKEWEDPFRKALVEFPKLCAREQDGVNIIKTLTGKTASVMIDPTLMLCAEEWHSIAHAVPGVPANFVLDYFLGNTPKTDPNYTSALHQANTENRVRLLDPSDLPIFTSGPAEFIWLISKANAVCTDSFHACVFAILFSKPFMVFKRDDSNNDMISRMETLFKLFGLNLEDCLGKFVKISDQVRDSILEKERKKVFDYFNQSPQK